MLAVSLATAEPARASWYALLIGAQGSSPGGADQLVFNQDVTQVAADLTSGKWLGYNLLNHTLILSPTGVPASSAAVTADLKALNTAMAGDPDPHLLFYFSGHGGTSTATAPSPPFNFDRSPALNTASEFLAYNPTTFDGVYDFNLPKLVTSLVPRAAHSLFIIDSCRSGGFFYGNPGAGVGNLDSIPTAYLIASAAENQNSPLHSALSANFKTFLTTKVGAFTGPQIAAGTGYSNLAFTDLRRDDLLGEGEISQFNDTVTETISSFAVGPDTDAIALVSVPEPGSMLLLTEAGLITAGLAWRRGGRGRRKERLNPQDNETCGSTDDR